jgi:iron(III) transport system permease protein
VRILENMTEVALGPAAAFSVFVIVVVFAVLTAIRLALSRVRAPGGATVDHMLGG